MPWLLSLLALALVWFVKGPWRGAWRRRRVGWLLSVGALASSLAAAQGSVVQSDQVRAELVAHAPQGVAPGETVWLGLWLRHAPHWHTYWRNPGDSGLPTELQWTLPPGFEAGEVAWPTPRKFPLGTLANYGYDGSVLLPVRLTVPSGFDGAQVDVTLEASWLACRKECIPEEGRFSLRLPAAGSTATQTALFEAAWAAAPRDQASAGSAVTPQTDGLALALEGLPTAWQGRRLEFFPEHPGLIEPGAAWQQGWDGPIWRASVPWSPHRSEAPEALTLVVSPADPPGEGPGLAGVRMTVAVPGSWPAAAALPAAVPDALHAALQANAERAATTAPADAAQGSLGLGMALLGALLGGLILNLMPCVFPVLAIKVMAFAQHAQDRRAHRLSGLAYSAGVVLSFLALGGALLALRAAGEAIGWGFQLQDPAVVAALAVLFTLLALNLAGLFEFGSMLPSAWASLQARHPVADAFLTGVLAVAVASPCTAPFMGASLGLAVTLPTGQALAVFAALGVGLALPYWVASWVPAVAGWLPRPGAWMVTLRQFLAFPMGATVVWLLWVLGQQNGIDGAAALLMALVLMAWLVWALGLRGRTRTLMAGAAALALVGWLVASGALIWRDPTGTPPAGAQAAQEEGPWSPWSPARQEALLAAGQPVFVDFTAAWCVTCQFNKRHALADPAVLAEARARGVALLRADWTRRDPEVTQALLALGRNGVPVYVLHRPGRAPQVLSEVLSPQEMLAALGS